MGLHYRYSSVVLALAAVKVAGNALSLNSCNSAPSQKWLQSSNGTKLYVMQQSQDREREMRWTGILSARCGGLLFYLLYHSVH